MAIYNMSKIKDWYDDFNSCKNSYLNSYYQNYKSSYIVTNNDDAVNKMQKKLDTYYTKIKDAYSKVGSAWKNLYNDLINADAALAGEKSSGSVNAPQAATKINSMPKLNEYKNDLNLTGAAAGTLAGTIAADVANVNVETNITVSDDVSNAASKEASGSEIAKTAAVGAAIGSFILPGVGTALGAATGAILSKTGVASKIKDWVKGIGQSIKQVAVNIGQTAKQMVNDLKGLSEAESVNDVLDVFKKTGATIATGVISLQEGVFKLVENVVDLVALVGTAVSSVVTGVADLGGLIKSKITGDESAKTNYTKQMWEKTRSFVATDHVGNLYDKFYDNTPVGQWIKNNAYGFDTVRSIGTELGEVVGIIAISVVTAGAGGAALSATSIASAATSSTTAIMYGATKIAEHTETNWQDENTSTASGLFKGIAQGTIDGVAWMAGSGLEKAATKVVSTTAKTLGQKVLIKGGKAILEGGTAVAQDLSYIGTNAIFSGDTIVDANGNTIKFNNLSEKFNYYYEQSGGASGLVKSAITAGILDVGFEALGVIGTKTSKGSVSTALTTLDSNPKTIANAVDDSIQVNTIGKAATNNLDEAASKVVKNTREFSVIGDHTGKDGIKRKIIEFADGTQDMIDEYGRSCVQGYSDIFEIEGFTKNVSNNSNAVKNTINDVDNAARNVKNGVDDTVKNTSKSKFTSTYDNVKSSVKNKVDSVKSKVSDATSSFKSRVKNVSSKLSDNAANLKNKTSDSISSAKAKFTSAKESISGKAKNLKDKINVKTSANIYDDVDFVKLRNEYDDLINQTQEPWFKQVQEYTAKGYAQNLDDVVKADQIVDRINEIRNIMNSSGATSGNKNIFSGVSNLKSKVSDATSSFKSRVKNVSSKLSDNAANLKNKTSDSISNAKAKFTSAKESIFGKAKNLKDKINVKTSANIYDDVDFVKLRNEYDDLINQTQEPWFKQVQEYTAKGYAQNLDDVVKADQIVDRINEIRNIMNSSGATSGNKNIFSGVSNLKSKVSDATSSFKSRIKNVSSKLSDNAANLKNKTSDSISSAKAKFTYAKESISGKAKNLKDSLNINNIKTNIRQTNGYKKISSMLNNIKTKSEYKKIITQLDEFSANAGINIDDLRKARRSSSKYKEMLDAANDVIEVRAIEKNLGIKSYFKNLESDEIVKNVNLTDMDEAALLSRYKYLTSKLDEVGASNWNKTSVSGAQVFQEVDGMLGKLDEVERKLGYSTGTYVSDTDLVSVNNEKAMTTIGNETGLSNDVYKTIIDDGVITDLSRFRNMLKKAAVGTSLATIFGIGASLASSQEETMENVSNTVTDEQNVNSNTVDVNEIEESKNDYSNIKIGEKIGDHNVSVGYDSASEAVESKNAEDLISDFVNGNSVFKRFAIVSDDGSVSNITNAEGLSLEEFCEKNNVDPSHVAIDVARKDGVSQAWVTASELNKSTEEGS